MVVLRYAIVDERVNEMFFRRLCYSREYGKCVVFYVVFHRDFYEEKKSLKYVGTIVLLIHCDFTRNIAKTFDKCDNTYFPRLLSPSLQLGQVHATLRNLVFVC